MPKQHPATAPGIMVCGVGYRNIFPLVQWRQALRTGVNRYWAGDRWTEIIIRNEGEGAVIRRGLRLHFDPNRHVFEVYGWFSTQCTQDRAIPGRLILEVSSFDPDPMAVALAKFSWNRDFLMLVVPVITGKSSLPITGARVTLYELKGELKVYMGTPP